MSLNDTFLYLNVVFLDVLPDIYFSDIGGNLAKLGLSKTVFCLSEVEIDPSYKGGLLANFGTKILSRMEGYYLV